MKLVFWHQDFQMFGLKQIQKSKYCPRTEIIKTIIIIADT